MTLRFGTDGVRGIANEALSPEFVTALGRAAARALGATECAIGRDSRLSGPLVQAALSAGLAAEGVRVVDLGVVPTPAIAYWAHRHGHPGAVISASHNAYPDNGVKFFAAGGHKLADAVQVDVETHLEELLERNAAHIGSDVPTGAAVGTIEADPSGRHEYVDHLVRGVLDGRRLDGSRVVVDAANGAASGVVADVLGGLGATVTVMNAAPDGCNINDHCGSTDPEGLRQAVTARRAHLGLALDGDADRLVAVDEAGGVVNGDALMAMFALDWAERGRLGGNRIVATVMSNLGLRRALEPAGIEVVECPVGDRSVLAAMAEHDLNLGGEQSGHLIFADLSTTGDGLLAGVLLIDLVLRAARPLSQLAAVIEPLPQVLRNVALDRPVPDLLHRVASEIEAAEARLGGDGRVLIRLSGTEPLARVMVEATDPAVAERETDGLANAVQRAAR